MAKDVIDQLALDIDIDVDKDIPETISALASSINELNNAVANVSNLQAYIKNLNKISAPTANVPKQTAIGQIIEPQTIDINTDIEQPNDGFDELKSNVEETNDAIKTTISYYQALYEELKKNANLISETSTKLNDGTNKLVQKFELVDEEAGNTTYTVTIFGDKIDKISTSFKSASKELDKMGKSTRGSGEQAKKSSGFWSKFVKSIGRIALYRAIRSAIKAVTDTMKEGIQNYVQYSDEANSAMSSITNSFGQLKNTLGVTLGYALETLEPIITAISDRLVDLINNVNMALAALSGKSTYSKAIKQNEDYAKSLDKVNSKLLSFDKFESLNNGDQQTNPSDMFEEVEVPEELTTTASIFKSIFEIVKELWGFVKIIGGWIKELWDKYGDTIKKTLGDILKVVESVAGWVLKIAEWGLKIVDWLDEVGLLEPILWGIVAVLGAMAIANAAVALSNPFTLIAVAIVAVVAVIAVLIKNFDKITAWFTKIATKINNFKNAFIVAINTIKNAFVNLWHNIANGFASMINKIVNGFVSLVNGFIDGLNAILTPIDKIAGIFGGSAQIPHWNFQMNWQPYAEGGTFEKGTAFIAGEKGAEVVYNSNQGNGGGVATIDQISQAQYISMMNAIQDSGLLSAVQNGGGDVYIDGRKAGQVLAKPVVNEGVRIGILKKVR